MLSRFFIDRPIFAWVIAIGLMLIGLGSILNMPIAQYPDIAPPAVVVTATYPGADPLTLESSVTQVIEQQLTGLDHLLYFSSTSSAAGSVQITATFDKGTDPNIAQVQVQNKSQQAIAQLPAQVQQEGLLITKANPDYLIIVGVYDGTDRAQQADVADWIVQNIEYPLGRLNGVGSTTLFGAGYAIRIWMDPYRMAALQLMPSDIASAVAAQNVNVTAGQLGQIPTVKGQALNAIVTAKSLLQTPEQFRRIVVKGQSNGAVVRLGDVARVEMGGDTYAHQRAVQRPSGRRHRHPAHARRRRLEDGRGGEGARAGRTPSRRAGASCSRATAPPSSACRSRRWSRPCSRPSSWSWW